MCDEMQWGWKSGLQRRENNEYVFLLSKEKQLEQPLQGDKTLRVG
jgi:hypothetical protein